MSKNMLFKSVPVLLAGFVLVGCGSPNIVAKPEPFNFEQVAKEPGEQAKQVLKVEEFGDGIKNTKKYVMGAFQVRVRTELSGQYGKQLEQPNKLGRGNDALFQKVTDDLYKEFVANLKSRGIEIVSLSSVKKYPEFQGMGSNSAGEGKWTLVNSFASGHATALRASGISNEYEEGDALAVGYVDRSTGGWWGDKPENNYQIFYPAAVPGLNYSTNRVTLFGATEYPIGDDIANPGTLPLPLLAAAAHDKLGVITAAFEVELVKYGRERTDQPGYTAGFTIGGGVPMVRTKLSALNMLPPGTERGTFFNSGGFTQGLRITTEHRGTRHAGMKAMFDSEFGYAFHWVEVADGSAVYTESEVINPVPAKFPAAFKKATDGNLQMIMYAIDHPSDF
ncbi:MAG: hypothetical protein HOO97_10665 [Sideroxydans sp.]|nr:hypothetical protein [Sideroxydans sp.]